MVVGIKGISLSLSPIGSFRADHVILSSIKVSKEDPVPRTNDWCGINLQDSSAFHSTVLVKACRERISMRLSRSLRGDRLPSCQIYKTKRWTATGIKCKDNASSRPDESTRFYCHKSQAKRCWRRVLITRSRHPMAGLLYCSSCGNVEPRHGLSSTANNMQLLALPYSAVVHPICFSNCSSHQERHNNYLQRTHHQQQIITPHSATPHPSACRAR